MLSERDLNEPTPQLHVSPVNLKFADKKVIFRLNHNGFVSYEYRFNVSFPSVFLKDFVLFQCRFLEMTESW